jgi:hypothetical protein
LCRKPGQELGEGEHDDRPQCPTLKPAAGLEIHAAFSSQRHPGEHRRANGDWNCHIKQQLHQVNENLWQRHDLITHWYSAFLLHARRAVLDPEFDQSCET